MQKAFAVLALVAALGGTFCNAVAQGTIDSVIARQCGATYASQREALRTIVRSEAVHNQVEKLAVDHHALDLLIARCWGNVRGCELECGVTPEYRIRNEYLDSTLLVLDTPAYQSGQDILVRRIVGEAHFICAQYWVTDPSERTGHDAQGDATLRKSLDFVATQHWLADAVDEDDKQLFASCLSAMNS